MRVAFVTVGNTKRLTGGYLYHARVFEGLRKEGIEIQEIVASGASPVEQEAAAARFGSRFDPLHFDVVVVDALACIVCAPWLDLWRKTRPVVAMVHELPSVVTGCDTARERKFEGPLLRADCLISVSNHGRFILESRGVPAGRIHVIPPGCDRLSLLPDTSVKLSGDVPVRALCVAQWIPRKGILDLIRAWAARERPGATLELVGETDVDLSYTAYVRAAIDDAPDASILVSGTVSDAKLGDAYAAADLFVLPSRYEGYGIVYAEALAYGLPIIACGVGPVPELVGKEAALLVPPGDVGALCGALDLFLGAPALRGRMSVAARHRTNYLPRWEDTVTAFRQVLEEVFALGSMKSEWEGDSLQGPYEPRNEDQP